MKGVGKHNTFTSSKACAIVYTILYIPLQFTPGNNSFYFTSGKAVWAVKVQAFHLLSLSPGSI